MRTATELLRAYVAGPHDSDSLLPLFTEDCDLEAPYFASIGMPWQFKGHQQLAESFKHLNLLYPGLHFENLRIVCATADTAVGEYEFLATSARTRRKIHQLSVIEIRAVDGKIALLREFQNIVEIALAVFPDGLDAVSIPDDRDLRIGAFSSGDQQ